MARTEKQLADDLRTNVRRWNEAHLSAREMTSAIALMAKLLNRR